MTTTAVKERPILFSPEMVRAILDGRKTMTRRIVKLPDWATCCDGRGRDVVPHWPDNGAHPLFGECYLRFSYCKLCGSMGSRVHCPFEVGGLLWVREAWGYKTFTDARNKQVIYRADTVGTRQESTLRWRPSIHMPRWASRITLEVTGVRVQRVQGNDEWDVRSEGLRRSEDGPNLRASFRRLWNDINAKRGYGWDANPWVWVVEFKRIGDKP